MFSVLFIVKHRCSVLDIQLKREPDDAWSVSISHAAEVLENWNLIGFQVSNTLVIIIFHFHVRHFKLRNLDYSCTGFGIHLEEK